MTQLPSTPCAPCEPGAAHKHGGPSLPTSAPLDRAAWQTPRLALRHLLRWLTAPLVGLVLVAAGCGGGVGTGGTGGFASGPITGFGSVIVNGVRFDDSAAEVEDSSGGRRSRDELRLGMTVDIDSGSITPITPTTTAGSVTATASATRIRFESELLGPISSVDTAGGSFMLLGQRVVVNAATVFDERFSGGLAGLAAPRVVEVYAVFDPAGDRYLATRVEPAEALATPRIRGPINQLDSAARTLRIGSTVYSYSTATGVPAGLAAGQFVRLSLAAAVNPARWTVQSFGTALRVLPDADGVKLRGVIDAFTSSRAFSVNGRPVDASSASFPNGSGGLAVGVQVEVEGRLRAGTLVASEVKLRSEDEDNRREFEISGAITAVDTAGRSFVLRGMTVSTTRSDLRYEDGTAADLRVARRVEVRGVLSADRQRIEATRIKFE